MVEQIRAAYGSRPVSFTTDCICGFPGETTEDFEESCAFLKKIGFLKVHVFPYSRRSGTPAYDLPWRIHEREKQERSRRMNAVAEQVRCEALAAFEGTDGNAAVRHPVHRLHPAVHSGGGLCPRLRERADRAGKAWPLRWRAGACSTLLNFFHFTCTFCASA